MAAGSEMDDGTGADQNGESKHPDEGMNLTDTEAMSLALRTVSDWLLHGDEPEWEDLPNLGEHAYGRLMDRLMVLGREMERRSAEYDATFGVDATALLDEAVR